MQYNQQTASTTEICLTESVAGYYCSSWQKTTETTYNYFDTISLIMAILLPLFFYRLFRRK